MLAPRRLYDGDGAGGSGSKLDECGTFNLQTFGIICSIVRSLEFAVEVVLVRVEGEIPLFRLCVRTIECYGECLTLLSRIWIVRFLTLLTESALGSSAVVVRNSFSLCCCRIVFCDRICSTFVSALDDILYETVGINFQIGIITFCIEGSGESVTGIIGIQPVGSLPGVWHSVTISIEAFGVLGCLKDILTLILYEVDDARTMGYGLSVAGLLG